MAMIKIFSIFLFGLCWGSFLNVCIYRIPRGISIVSPPSSCPNCGTKVKAYDNIPIISFILLRAKCRACGEKISYIYPIVELTTALIFLGLYLRYGISVDSALYGVFCSALIVISFIDLEHKIIPDILSLGGAGAGLIASLKLTFITFWDSFLGLLLGGGLLFLVAFVYLKVRKLEGMGGGDIKLLGMIGAWLGYKAIIPVLLFASLGGVLVGLPFILIKKDRYFQIPFGPFLSGAAVLSLVWDIRLVPI